MRKLNSTILLALLISQAQTSSGSENYLSILECSANDRATFTIKISGTNENPSLQFWDKDQSQWSSNYCAPEVVSGGFKWKQTCHFSPGQYATFIESVSTVDGHTFGNFDEYTISRTDGALKINEVGLNGWNEQPIGRRLWRTKSGRCQKTEEPKPPKPVL